MNTKDIINHKSQDLHFIDDNFIFAQNIMGLNQKVIAAITLSNLDFYNLARFVDKELAKNARRISQQTCELLLDIALAHIGAHADLEDDIEGEEFENADKEEEHALASLEEIGKDRKHSRILRIIPKQSHSTRIVKIERAKNSSDEVIEADGLYTFDSNVSLGVTVADCVGIVLYEERSGFIAVLHSGWKGTLGVQAHTEGEALIMGTSIVRSCIEHCVEQEGIMLESLYVWLSPSAKSCCYEIGEELAKGFAKYNKVVRKEAAKTSKGKKHRYFADMSRYIEQELYDLGIKSSQVEISPYCTICDTRFHSHRRTQESAGRAQVFITKK